MQRLQTKLGQISNLSWKFNYQKSSSAIPLQNVFLVVKSGKVPLRKLKRIWAPNMDIVPVPVRSVFLFPFLIMLLMRSKYCCSSWFFEDPFSMVAKSKMIIKRILLKSLSLGHKVVEKGEFIVYVSSLDLRVNLGDRFFLENFLKKLFYFSF